MVNTMEPTNKGKNKLYKVLAAVFGACFLAGLVWLAVYIVQISKQNEADKLMKDYVLQTIAIDPSAGQEMPQEPSSEEEQETGAADEEQELQTQDGEAIWDRYRLPYRAVDIQALQSQENKDIYAWLSVPGTIIDYPVLQHPEEMDYYLEHNLDGSTGRPGAVYTQRINSRDWTDKNTVLYGHNMNNGTMFADLHKYEDLQFFEENPYICIYTEDGKILIYQIFAAYAYSDDHLLLSIWIATDEAYQQYLDGIRLHDGLNDHFNQELTLTAQDKIITLSTCIKNKPSNRWLVQGVLIEEGEQEQIAED